MVDAECEIMLRERILELAMKRGTEKSICPSEVSRSLFKDWREHMDDCREVGWKLAAEGSIEVCQGGVPVQPPIVGPIRFRATNKIKK